MARRNRARQAAHIVVAIPGIGERARRRDERRRVLLEQDFMLDAVERLEVTPRELHPLLGQVIVDLPHRHLRAVDEEALVAVFDAVARQAHYEIGRASCRERWDRWA